jgi:hypothetical protein
MDKDLKYQINFNLKLVILLNELNIKENQSDNLYTQVINYWIYQYNNNINNNIYNNIELHKELKSLHNMFIENPDLFINIYNFHISPKDYKNLLENKGTDSFC